MNIPGAYSQRDGRWSGQELGFNTDPAYSIYHYGCLLTTVANLFWYTGHNIDPGTLNTVMKANNGFVRGGGVMNWAAVTNLNGDLVSQNTTSNFINANTYVEAEGHFAILEVTKPGFPQHFVLLALVNQIVDPWDGMIKNWSSSGYTFVNAHLYGDKTPDFTTNPQPVTQTVQAAAAAPHNPEDDLMTADQEKAAYEIVLGREPEAGYPLGNRTALTFIQDAKGELQQSRNDAAATRAALASAQGTITSLNAELDKLQPEYERTVKLLNANYLTTKPCVAVDFSDLLEPVELGANVIIDSDATFSIKGVEYARTATSYAQHGAWYGVPIADLKEYGSPISETPVLDLAGASKALSTTQTIHALTADATGGAQSIIKKIFGGK